MEDLKAVEKLKFDMSKIEESFSQDGAYINEYIFILRYIKNSSKNKKLKLSQLEKSNLNKTYFSLRKVLEKAYTNYNKELPEIIRREFPLHIFNDEVIILEAENHFKNKLQFLEQKIN